MSKLEPNHNRDRKDSQWDFAEEASEQLLMLLENSLDLFGRPTTIFDPVVVDNAYAHVYDDAYSTPPDYVEPTEHANPNPTGTCRVLLGQPIRGLPISDFISLSDKVDSEIQVRTDTELKTEAIIEVQYPDNKIVRVRIVRGDGFHADSFKIFQYIGIVCGPE